MIIVTGAAGFIGGVISLKLKDAGYSVVGIDRRPCPEQLRLCFDQFIESDFVNALDFIAGAMNYNIGIGVGNKSQSINKI